MIRKKGIEVLNILICDDDGAAAHHLETMILQLGQEKNLPIHVEVFLSYSDLIHHKCDISSFDIAFLDIEMPHMDGIEVGKWIRSLSQRLLIIYVSSHTQYVFETFQNQPFQFLVKPVIYDTLRIHLSQAISFLNVGNRFFEFKIGKRIFRENIADILYFESMKRLIKIQKVEGEVTFYGKLIEIEKAIDNMNGMFLRINQSILIHFQYIKELSAGEVVMSDGKVFSISKDKRKSVAERYSYFVEKEREWK